MIAQLASVYSVFLENEIMSQKKKKFWLYNQLPVEGAMYLLHLVCIAWMFIKYICR